MPLGLYILAILAVPNVRSNLSVEVSNIVLLIYPYVQASAADIELVVVGGVKDVPF